MPAQKPDIYDLGLAADLQMLRHKPIDRRHLLRLGAASLSLLLTSCAASSGQGGTATTLPLMATADVTPTTAATASAITASTATSTVEVTASATAAPAASATSVAAVCVDEIPSETAGPFPADGSNASNQNLNVLTRSGVVRNDIRSSLSTGNIAAGVPLTIALNLVEAGGTCAPLAGYAVYIWHCDRDGNYSLYSSAVTDEDYLRGVQASDSSGVVRFTSIFPACYPGRWPHVHFEIFPSLATATDDANIVHTSQLALPQDICETVYATEGYAASVGTLAQLSLDTDNIFRDGYNSQLATISGDLASGYIAQLTVGITA
jgi:protocatechuate 3,4-dioxygenase beta subunit